MWYKNFAGRFFGLVTKRACDRQTDTRTDGRTDGRTDRITTRRAVKMNIFLSDQLLMLLTVRQFACVSVCGDFRYITTGVGCDFVDDFRWFLVNILP